jgi:hypothetical protein
MEDAGVLSPTEFAKRMLNKEQRKESIKNIKENIKGNLTEIRHEVKDTVKHLPDGHRGHIGAVVERPIPPYKPIKPGESDQDTPPSNTRSMPKRAATVDHPPTYDSAMGKKK